MISAEVMDAIVILLQIIEQQDWMSFRSAVLSNPAYFLAITRAIASCPEYNGMTLLHAVARCNPPSVIVAEMIEICPDLPAAKDCLGRTPLHVATGSTASPKVIKLIAHAHPTSCTARDEDGKTPLHFACDVTCELFEGDIPIKKQVPRRVCHDTVRALLSESIHSATIEDMDEMNSVEYAIMSDAQLKTVKMLQWASSRSLELTHPPSTKPRPFSPRPRATAPLRVSFKEDEIMLEGSRVPYV